MATSFFFGYRYWIACERKQVVKDYDLLSKLNANKPLDESDRQVLYYLISSLHRSRESWNYLLIFVISLVAIVADLILAAIV